MAELDDEAWEPREGSIQCREPLTRSGQGKGVIVGVGAGRSTPHWALERNGASCPPAFSIVVCHGVFEAKTSLLNFGC